MHKCVLCHANNKGEDQPAHPRSLISTFVVHCLDSLYMYTWYIQSFKILVSFCSWAGWFDSYLVKNPQRQFSRAVAHMYYLDKNQKDADQTVRMCWLISLFSADLSLLSTDYHIFIKFWNSLQKFAQVTTYTFNFWENQRFLAFSRTINLYLVNCLSFSLKEMN